MKAKVLILSMVLSLMSCSNSEPSPTGKFHTVTFNTNGGSYIAPQMVAHSEKITKPDDPTKGGYAFDKWTYQGEEWSFVGYLVSEDMTLDANWILKTYNITYILDGGTNDPLNPAQYSAESENLTLYDASKLGYNFLGWEYEGEYIDKIDKTIFKDITLTARWEISEGNEEIDDFIVEINGNDVISKQYTGKKNNVHIPKVITKIGTNTFQHCYSLISLTIPDSVTSIEANAFVDCYRLVEVINKSSLSLTVGSADNGNVALYAKQVISEESESKLITDENGYVIYKDGTKNILMNYVGEQTELTIPDTITKISKYAFLNCSLLTGVTIPDCVTSIGEGALSGCSSLEYVNLPFIGETGNISTPSSNTLFGYVFGRLSYSDGVSCKQYYSSSKYTTFYIPASLKRVKINGGALLYGAFYGCKSISSIDIANGVVSLAEAAFEECSSLTSITLPNTITSISYNAFYRCASLPSIVIPDSVTVIDGGSFLCCYSLSSVTIPNSVTHIETAAFRYCYSLTSITIPNSVTFIGENAFTDCHRLVEVINESSLSLTVSSADNGNVALYAKQVITDKSESRLSEDDNGFTIYDDGIDKWVVNYTGNQNELVIPDSFTKINQCAFRDNKNLTSITIPNTVTSIGMGAFISCSSISSIQIPNSVTSIGTNAFESCSSLTSIIIPNSVTLIGAGAFEGCLSLTEVNIPEGVTKIDSYAFSRCVKLSFIQIPDSVTSIGEEAFFNANLSSVVIGKGVTSISKKAFYGNYKLKTVFYTGSIDDWNLISIGSNNDYLKDASRYYYSETEPTEPGNYWHYVNGVASVWDL